MFVGLLGPEEQGCKCLFRKLGEIALATMGWEGFIVRRWNCTLSGRVSVGKKATVLSIVLAMVIWITTFDPERERTLYNRWQNRPRSSRGRDGSSYESMITRRKGGMTLEEDER